MRHNGLIHELAVEARRKLSPNLAAVWTRLWIHSSREVSHGSSDRPARRRAGSLGDAARRLQPSLAERPCSGRSGRSRTCSTASGSGHPLHAAATDIPIGTLLAGRRPRPRRTSAAAADVALVATILFMLAVRRDRAPPTTPTPTARPGSGRPLHSTLMVVALVLLLVSLVMRAGAPADRTRRRSRSSIIGFLLVTAGAYRRRRRRLRLRQHGQPPRLPGRRDEVDQARPRRRRPTSRRSPRRRRPRPRPGINDLVLVRVGDTIHALHAVVRPRRRAARRRARSSTAASSARGTARASG